MKKIIIVTSIDKLAEKMIWFIGSNLLEKMLILNHNEC